MAEPTPTLRRDVTFTAHIRPHRGQPKATCLNHTGEMVKLARNVAGEIRLPKLPTSRNVNGLPDQLGESTDGYTVEGYRHPYRVYQKTNELDPLRKVVLVLRDVWLGLGLGLG